MMLFQMFLVLKRLLKGLFEVTVNERAMSADQLFKISHADVAWKENASVTKLDALVDIEVAVLFARIVCDDDLLVVRVA